MSLRALETFDDEAAREAIRGDLESSVLVEASAGTGKTTELISRVVAVLASGRARADAIAAVTFTKKAAGELKLRLRGALEREREAATGAVRENLEHAIAHLEEARIGTIHGFCADMLRERPVEAGVDPLFEELAEAEQQRLFDAAFDRWLEAELQEMPETLRRALIRPPGWQDAPPRDRLRQAAHKLLEWRDFSTEWQLEPFDRRAEIDALLALLVPLAETSARAANPNDPLFLATRPLRGFCERFGPEARGAERDDDALESALIALRDSREDKKRQSYGRYAPDVDRAQLTADLARFREALGDFSERAEANLAALLQRELRSFERVYAEKKKRAGKLDFVDLLLSTRELLRANATVRRYFRDRFTHIFVDEFQDTDVLQIEILLLLAADDPEESDWRRVRPSPGKLFLVGDPKQSIYRFRRADVVLYQTVKRQLIERGVRVVHLTRSFRSTLPLQSLVNAAFETALAEDPVSGQPGYVPLTGGAAAPAEQPSLVALPVPRPLGGWGRVNKDAIGASLPDATGALIQWMVESSGWTVRDPEDAEK